MIKPSYFVGYGIIISLIYIFGSHLLTVAPIFSNILGYGIENDFLREVQHKYYQQAPMRSIIQGDANCAAPDENLGYVAKNGDCEFSNFEFDTTLKFSDSGAVIDTKVDKSLPEIIVVGDSHAMGWGVSYNETFAYKLGNLGYKVRNYSMSSYGTEQEINSALKSDIFNESRYVVFQYCENDISINKRDLSEYVTWVFKDYSKRATKNIETLSFNQKMTNAAQLLYKEYSFTETLSYPIKILKTVHSGDYKSAHSAEETVKHQEYFLKVINRYPKIQEKKIIAFYSNGYGRKFESWERVSGNVNFVDLNLSRDNYNAIDDHLNLKGHLSISSALNHLILGFETVK
jgi:hypothetical protein